MLSSLIVGAGCFWGVEVLYEQMPGVINATSGYSGGHLDYDSSEVTFNELIDTFFIIHDPTTLNRQGPDIGEQYKSILFFNSVDEKEIIESKIEKIDLSGKFENPIVTEIRETAEFYPSEEYHQDYAVKTGKLCYQQLYVMYNYSPIPTATP